MSKLDLLQKTIYQIKTLIQNDKNIRKLLLHDVNNALEAAEVPYDEAEEYIVLSPIFDMTKEPFNKNTIISIALSRGVKAEDEKILNGIVKINVLTQSTLWPLTDNKIRPLEIANRLMDLLDGTKMATSHKLVFNVIEVAILNENVNGYSLSFYLNEGSDLIAEF